MLCYGTFVRRIQQIVTSFVVAIGVFVVKCLFEDFELSVAPIGIANIPDHLRYGCSIHNLVHYHEWIHWKVSYVHIRCLNAIFLRAVALPSVHGLLELVYETTMNSHRI